jgi:hypothetical protein
MPVQQGLMPLWLVRHKQQRRLAQQPLQQVQQQQMQQPPQQVQQQQMQQPPQQQQKPQQLLQPQLLKQPQPEPQLLRHQPVLQLSFHI